MKGEDFEKLEAFCRINALSYEINFWESDGSYSVGVRGPAENEDYYQKRIVNMGHFIACAIEKISQGGKYHYPKA